MIHHVAIATPNLKLMGDFYKNLSGLKWKEDKFNDDKKIRSVWFDIQKSNSLLMLEDFPYSKAPEALIFQIDPFFNLEKSSLKITKRTDYTIYFLDPDKNQLGYSSYPIKLGDYSI